MKAAIYNGQKNIALVELPTPEPGADDILLKNLEAGVCGSDVSAYLHGPRAHRITPGHEFGHEVVSRVVARGRNVQTIDVGQRVYPYPLLAKGDPSRAGTLGGFSEYILVPNAELGKQVYAVPESISDTTASMIEPLTVATHAAKRGQPQPGEKAVVFGAGTIGIGAAIALQHLGCSKVMLVDLSEFRLRKAAALGFETCNSRAEDLMSKAAEVFGSARSLTGATADVDLYIEAAGADSLISTYQTMGKLFSRLVVVGVHGDPVPVDLPASHTRNRA